LKSADRGIGRLPQEPVDKLYTSGNPFIRWLLNRLLKKTSDLLLTINAASLSGLDVGCGEGNFIDYLTRQKAIGFLVAIELDNQKLRFAKQQYPDFTYLNADVNTLNFKNDSFDYIIASEIIEHLPDPMNAIREIRRVAKDNAYFIVSVPHEPFFRWGNLIRGKYWKRGGRTPTHVNFWTRSEFKKFIGNVVEIEKEHWFSVFPWMLYLGKIKQIPNDTDRRL
jgi:ubiquinone/menaquinone biosynthesis C-methylase UbiE